MSRKEVVEIPILGTDYSMTHDSLCWTLYRRKSEGKSKSLVGHYPKLRDLIKDSFQDIINNSDASSMTELKAAIEAAENKVAEIAANVQLHFDELNAIDDSDVAEDVEEDDDFLDDGLNESDPDDE